jgi:hypothetical protein
MPTAVRILLALSLAAAACDAIDDPESSTQALDKGKPPSGCHAPCRPHPDGFWGGYDLLRDAPSDGEPAWSNVAQGLAHDEANWYITQRDAIYKYPVGASIGGNGFVRSVRVPGGCNHIGDPDFDAGRQLLYVPMEGCPGGNQLYIYDTDLRIRSWEYIPGGHAAWIAFDPTTGLLFTSEFDASQINGYRLSGTTGGWMGYDHSISLNGTFRAIQGGEFSRLNPTHFYLSSDDHESAAVHAFEVNGNQATWRRLIWPGGGLENSEVEGLTLWDLDQVPGKSPDVGGQIHFIIVRLSLFDDDNVDGRHVRVWTPSEL